MDPITTTTRRRARLTALATLTTLATLIVAGVVVTPAVAEARWGTGPIAAFKASRDIKGLIKRHGAELSPIYTAAARSGLRRATLKRVVATAEAGVAATGGYACFLGSLAANPPIIIGGTAVTCLAGTRSLGNLVGAYKVSRAAKQAGREAVYLHARQSPTLSAELRPGTITYFDYHLTRRSGDLAAAAQQLQQRLQQAGVALAADQR